MGDVIHNLAVASDLTRLEPGIEIHWATESPYAPLVALHPDVKCVWPISLRAVKKEKFGLDAWRKIRTQRNALAEAQADWVLDTQGLLKSALIGRGASAPLRGYDKASIREPLAAHFYAQKFFVSKTIHAVERNRVLAALALGKTLADVPRHQLDYGLARRNAPLYKIAMPEWLQTLKATRSPYWVFLTATSRDAKMWPKEHWATLATYAQKRGITTVWPGGSERECAFAADIAQHSPNPALTLTPPLMTLVEAAQLLMHSQAVVGVDTGLSHLAVALDRPTVGIYTATNPGLTGLYGRGTGTTSLAENMGGIGNIPEARAVFEEVETLLRFAGERTI